MFADTSKFFVVGLPGAGKTTFLAALWHVVEFAEVPEALKLTQLEGDKSYLNQIRALWVDAKPLERTKVSDETTVSMTLVDESGQSSLVWLPDLSGESFEAQWTDRVASPEYAKFVEASSGGMLFIHPEVREEHLIAEAQQLVPQLAGMEQVPDEIGQGADEVVPWEPRKAPTQIQLVDLLQFLAILNTNRPLKLAVIISAWDLISPPASPAEWLAKRLPLLHQYLKTHNERLEVSVFGISAQGGDLTSAEQLHSIKATEVPAARLRVVSTIDHGHDITAPIRWLMTRS